MQMCLNLYVNLFFSKPCTCFTLRKKSVRLLTINQKDSWVQLSLPFIRMIIVYKHEPTGA